MGRELHFDLLLSAFLIRAWLLSSPLLRVQSLVRQLDWYFKFGASAFPESTVHILRASSVLWLTLVLQKTHPVFDEPGNVGDDTTPTPPLGLRPRTATESLKLLRCATHVLLNGETLPRPVKPKQRASGERGVAQTKVHAPQKSDKQVYQRHFFGGFWHVVVQSMMSFGAGPLGLHIFAHLSKSSNPQPQYMQAAAA